MEKECNGSCHAQKLTNEQGRILLRLARRTIAEKLGYGVDDIEIPDEEIFRSARGTFVTLKIDRQLRGCIGNLESDRSVVEGIADNAVNAAFRDHRFQPLSSEEFDKIDVEVSILTTPVPLEYQSPEDLISRLRPGIDGVIIRKGNAGATFLPQVWEQLPDPAEFLGHLCRKAGLSEKIWQSMELEISLYQVQYFEET